MDIEQSRQGVRESTIQFKNVLQKHLDAFGEDMTPECLENISEYFGNVRGGSVVDRDGYSGVIENEVTQSSSKSR